jgi:hypothetical protein
MARHSIPRSGGTSKFRMVVIDAELQEGEISQLAQAIQGAFSGQPRVTAMRLNGSTARSLPGPDSDAIPAGLDGAEIIEDAGAVPTAPAPARPKAQKKLRTPKLDTDLHPEEDPSFKAYAETRNITGATKVLQKFLVVASWLDEERSGMPITADRAYTCFRFIGWPYNIDFDQPLRDLKAKNKFLEQKPEHKGKGEFSVTHLGLDRATKMRVAS